MENASEALKLAASVLVFVMAITVTIALFSQARETSEIVLQSSDVTSYYDYQDYTKKDRVYENRIVGLETIIPTLYKYNKENYRIEFWNGTYNGETGEYTMTTPLTIYTTVSNEKLWSDGYKSTRTYEQQGNSKKIYAFDFSEEILRNESWLRNQQVIIKNLNYILEGNTQDSGNLSYSNNPLTKTQNKYLELVRKYQNEDTSNKNKTTTKTVIKYIKI